MRALVFGCVLALMAGSASAAGFADMARDIEENGLDYLGSIYRLEKQKGRRLTDAEMQDVRRQVDEAQRRYSERQRLEGQARDAHKERLVKAAPGLMTDALQRQCFDFLRGQMNDPASLKIAGALEIDPGGSTTDIPQDQVQFVVRIWGRNPYGATVGAVLLCRYAVEGEAMQFRVMGLNPSRTGLLAGR